jgi:hypothetical protein
MQNSAKETVFMSDDLLNIIDLNVEEIKPINIHVNYIEHMYPVLSLEKSKKNTTLTLKSSVKLLTDLLKDLVEYLYIYVGKEKIVKLDLKTSSVKLKVKNFGDSYIIKLKLKNNMVSEAKNGI